MSDKDELVKQIDQAEKDINVAKYEQELALEELVNHLLSTREVNDLPPEVQRLLIDVTMRRDKINKLSVFKANLKVDMDLTA
jgi:hypothetical protein